MAKVIALDLDGTLLKNDHESVSTFTKNVLQTLEKKGHKVVITTGRAYRVSQHIYQNIGLTSPMLVCNGAIGLHPLDAQWSGEFYDMLPLDIAKQLVALQQRIGIGWIALETRTGLYATTDVLPDSPFFPTPNLYHHLTEVSQLTSEPIAFGWFSTEDEQVDIKEAIATQLSIDLGIKTWGGALPCLDITLAGVHKASGLAKLLAYYQLTHEDLMAFGDQHNDVEMLAFAKYGIAMLNGIDDLKQVAYDVTTYTNDQDGVAHYLNAFFGLGLTPE